MINRLSLILPAHFHLVKGEVDKRSFKTEMNNSKVLVNSVKKKSAMF